MTRGSPIDHPGKTPEHGDDPEDRRRFPRDYRRMATTPNAV
jgi:hypothetical protein